MSALFDDGRDENNRNKSRGRERKKGGQEGGGGGGGWMDVELWSYNNNHGRESWPCELRR